MTDKLPHAINEGIIRLANDTIQIPCAVLNDGRRLLTQSGLMLALGRARQAKGRQYYDADVNMPAFLTAKNLKPFITKDLEVTSSQIEFKPLRASRAFGYDANLLPKVCGVFIDADEAQALTASQRHIAVQARILIRGLAGIGILALVDEATGYQEIRDRDALQKILDKYLREEYAKWAKTFPDEFYQQIFRLRGWDWKGMKVNRPSVVAHYTNDLVYARLAPGVLEKLQQLNPRINGKRAQKQFQWLTEDYGMPALKEHLIGVVAIMRGATTWEQSQRMVQRAFPKVNTNLEIPYPEND